MNYTLGEREKQIVLAELPDEAFYHDATSQAIAYESQQEEIDELSRDYFSGSPPPVEEPVEEPVVDAPIKRPFSEMVRYERVAEKSHKFPIDILPPHIKAMCEEMEYTLQIDTEAAFVGFMGYLPVVTQRLGLVAMGDRKTNLSMAFMTIMESGGGKSRAMGGFAKVFDKFTRDNLTAYKEDMLKYEAQEKALKADMAKESKTMESISGTKFDETSHQLSELESERPIRPDLVTTSATSNGMILKLSDLPCFSLITDEGGGVLDGHSVNAAATSYFATLTTLYDGGVPNNTTGVKESHYDVMEESPRTSISLSLQPTVSDEFFSKNRQFIDQGLGARFMYSKPISSAGKLDYYKTPKPMPTFDAITSTMLALLGSNKNIANYAYSTANLESNRVSQDVFVTMSEDAADIARQWFTKTEKELSTKYQSIKFIALRRADNVIKMAGNLAIFDHAHQGKTGPVSICQDTMVTSLTLVDYFLESAIRMLGDKQVSESDEAYKSAYDLAKKSKGSMLTITLSIINRHATKPFKRNQPEHNKRLMSQLVENGLATTIGVQGMKLSWEIVEPSVDTPKIDRPERSNVNPHDQY